MELKDRKDLSDEQKKELNELQENILRKISEIRKELEAIRDEADEELESHRRTSKVINKVIVFLAISASAIYCYLACAR